MAMAIDLTNDFLSCFPLFRNHTDLTQALLQQAGLKEVPAQTHLYWEGDTCAGIAFVLSGEIRVYRCGENGREITLYEIGPGETCILNASCLVGNIAYPANAVTTTSCQFLYVAAQEFRRLIDTDATIRTYVFSLMSQRLTGVMELVNEVAFGRMDERLMDYLVEKSTAGKLTATHQKIANDLGTSREVVSRLLKDFERQGRVRLARSEIRVVALAE